MSKVGCFPLPFLRRGSLPVKPSTASPFVPVRVIVIQFAGEDWPDCEGVAPGDVNFGLGQGWYHSEVTWGLTG